MLITSPRHTPADLRLWAEYEEADQAWAQLETFQRKVDKSITVIREFAADGPCYCGVSAGKDSTVLANLIFRADVDVPFFYVRAGCDANPDSSHVLSRIPGVREIMIEYPPGCAEAEGDRIFFAALASLGSRYFSGIRADESHGRRMRMCKHGLSTVRTCAPLGWWKSQDVFAYLAVNNLPVHPAYACLGGGRWTREHIRVDELGGERGTGMGRSEWEREYYPR